MPTTCLTDRAWLMLTPIQWLYYHWTLTDTPYADPHTIPKNAPYCFLCGGRVHSEDPFTIRPSALDGLLSSSFRDAEWARHGPSRWLCPACHWARGTLNGDRLPGTTNFIQLYRAFGKPTGMILTPDTLTFYRSAKDSPEQRIDPDPIGAMYARDLATHRRLSIHWKAETDWDDDCTTVAAFPALIVQTILLPTRNLCVWAHWQLSYPGSLRIHRLQSNAYPIIPASRFLTIPGRSQ